ncbi:MAG: glycosyltransferase family 2 protein [Planctomycetota bacterium]
MDQARRLISIVTPCFNEELNVHDHFERVCKAIEPFRARYDFEHVYTDNCSTDRTFELLRELGAKHPNVKALRFARNIGANRAIYFGLAHAKGDAAVLIQADLQDPPELIPDFIKGWEEGFDVVYGQTAHRKEFFLLSALRGLYYRIVTGLSDVPIPRNAGEFRITSRRVLDAIREYGEDDLYLRGAIAHIGFKQKAISFERAARAKGVSSINFLGLVGYAINGLTSTTVAPIRAVTIGGLLTAALGFTLTAVLVAAKVLFPGGPPHGFTTLASLVTFFAGVQLFAIGVIGEYIRKIYTQSLRRPRGFIQDKVNL